MTADVIHVGVTEDRIIHRLKLDTTLTCCFKDKLGSNGEFPYSGLLIKTSPSPSKSHVYQNKKEEQEESN